MNTPTFTASLAVLSVVAFGSRSALAGDKHQADAALQNATQVEPARVADAAPAAVNTPSAHEDAKPPKIRWSSTPAKDTRDARVAVGTMRISMPNANGSSVGPETPPAPADPTLIVVPNNTGPRGPASGVDRDEALWQRNERINAANRLAKARADLAELQLERETLSRDRGRSSAWGTTVVRVPHLGGSFGHRHHGFALVGPVTTSTTTFNDLGSTARRAFAEAATPRIGGVEQDRASAVIRFGNDASPQIVQPQRDRDAAVIKANSENAPK